MFFLRSLKSAWDYEKPPKVQTDVVDMQNISSVGAFYAGIEPFYSKHRILVLMSYYECMGTKIGKIIQNNRFRLIPILTSQKGGPKHQEKKTGSDFDCSQSTTNQQP